MSPRRMQQASTSSRAPISGSGTSGVDTSSLPPPPTSYPLYVRIRAVVADWEVPQPERRREFLIADPSSIPEIKEIDEDSDEKRTRAAIRGTNEGRRGQTSKGGLNPSLLRSTMEHMIREVISEKSFGQVVEDMLAQDTPFFLQYEDSPPPGESDHRQAGAPSIPIPPDRQPSMDGGFDELKALLNRPPQPAWRSELLCDFAEPPLAELVDERLTVKSLPSGGRKGIRRPSATSAGGNSKGSGDKRPTSGGSQSSQARGRVQSRTHSGPSSPGAGEVTPSQAMLDEAMYEHGEVDLEAFKASAGDVLDEMLLGVMDDVIAGRLNWQRPLPRIRGRAR